MILGRYTQDKGWGILVPSKVAWFVMESPNLWVSAISLYISRSHGQTIIPIPNIILMSLYIFHYINRSIVYPCKMTNTTPMPLSVMASAFLFCCWNGFNISTFLLILHRYDDSYMYDIRFMLGVSLFVIGWLINFTSDNTLLLLRGKTIAPSDHESKLKYKIPKGGMFEYVSCANYCKSMNSWVFVSIVDGSHPSMEWFNSLGLMASTQCYGQ